MKTKRLYALVLCLLLVCGAAVLLAYAAPAYTDGDLIGEAYADAIGEMTGLGVLNGFPDGSFRPYSGLTREQGAKIIAYLILTPGTADGLTYASAPFFDVPADRWSAAVVAWCAEMGIVHGMGDGSFRPDDPLTGQQFAKILLCASGLGEPDRYLGDGWDIRVTEDAGAAGLLDGDPEMCTDRPISRMQASLMAFNAQNAAEGATSAAVQQPGTEQKPAVDPQPGVGLTSPADPAPGENDTQPSDPTPGGNEMQPPEQKPVDPPVQKEDPIPTVDPLPPQPGEDEPEPSPGGDDNETNMMTDF